MKKEKILGKYRMNLNYEKFGYYHYILYFQINKFHEVRKEIYDYILNHKLTFWGAETFPKMKLKVEIIAKNMFQVDEFVDGIKR